MNERRDEGKKKGTEGGSGVEEEGTRTRKEVRKGERLTSRQNGRRAGTLWGGTKRKRRGKKGNDHIHRRLVPWKVSGVLAANAALATRGSPVQRKAARLHTPTASQRATQRP